MKTIFILITLTLFSVSLFAQATFLDSTFSGDGIVTTSVVTGVDGAHAVAIQQDGKIVTGGSSCNYFNGCCYSDFAWVRYNANGTVDSTFGINGIVKTDFDSTDDQINSIAIQPDGKILAAGYSSPVSTSYCFSYDLDFALARYNTDGTLDSSFGTNGKLTAVFDSSYQFEQSAAYSVAIQSDGKIIAIGYSTFSTYGGYGEAFAFMRFNSNGSIDSSFSTDGKATVSFGSDISVASSMALQSDGKIIAAGGKATQINYEYSDIVLIRYNIDGDLDSTFGINGIVTTGSDSANYWAGSIAIQTDGKILAAGSSELYPIYTKFALIRYNANGQIDSTFGNNGITTTSILTSNYSYEKSMVQQADGKIILVGYSENNFDGLVLARYNYEGYLDSSFGINGILITNINMYSAANSANIQTDDKLIVAGWLDGNFSVIRLLANLSVGIINFTTQETSPLIYPNPIQQNEILQYTLTKDEELTLSLYDVNGRLIKNFFTQQKRNAGEYKEELNMGNLAAGNYLLTLSNGEYNVSVKLVKQ